MYCYQTSNKIVEEEEEKAMQNAKRVFFCHTIYNNKQKKNKECIHIKVESICILFR